LDLMLLKDDPGGRSGGLFLFSQSLGGAGSWAGSLDLEMCQTFERFCQGLAERIGRADIDALS
jgi:hypothetical protein